MKKEKELKLLEYIELKVQWYMAVHEQNEHNVSFGKKGLEKLYARIVKLEEQLLK